MRIDQWAADAIDQIEAADISAPTYRTARRLLDLSIELGGSIKLSYASMQQICGSDSSGTIRRHLGALAKCGIIHYSTNDYIYVAFHAAGPIAEITQRAPTRTERAQTPTDDPSPADPVITQRAPTRAERAQNWDILTERAPTRAERASNWLVGGGIPSSSNGDLPPTTNHYQMEGDPRLALLIDPDVGLSADAAAGALTESMDLDYLLRVVGGWWLDIQAGRVKGGGALLHRLRKRWAGGPLTSEFQSSELYRRHAPAAVRSYALPPELEPIVEPDDDQDPEPASVAPGEVPPPPFSPDDPATLWPNLLALAKDINPKTADWADSMSTARANYDGDRLTITCSSNQMAISRRMEGWIARQSRRIFKIENLHVEFQLMEDHYA